MPLQATSGAASYDAFGGGVPVVPAYIEEVFGTYLYTGNDTVQTITNGIDLSTKGGAVFIKSRNLTSPTVVYDTNRGINKALCTNLTNAENVGTLGTNQDLNSFNTNGFAVNLFTNAGGGFGINNSAHNLASWTFRKQPKFFDVVTWTGSNDSGTSIGQGIVPHNLGSAPGCVIIKNVTQGSTNWIVYHRSLSGGYRMLLNTTDAQTNSGSAAYFSKYVNGVGWTQTDPDANNIYVGYNYQTNGNGDTLVAYVFAHDAGGFGLTGTDNVISCGSFTATGSAQTVTLGYEPQWVLVKSSNNADNWYILDNMRGLPVSEQAQRLFANTSGAEGVSATLAPTATGFSFSITSNFANSGYTYIYIAIRRGPMKVPTSGTSVFSPVARAGTSATATVTAGFPVDMTIIQDRTQNSFAAPFDRLRGATNRLFTPFTAAEASEPTTLTSFAVQDGFTLGTDLGAGFVNTSGDNYINWNFRRAPSFFDEVCYTGTGVARTVTHNLTVVPELMFVKARNAGTSNWACYSSDLGNTKVLTLNDASAAFTTSLWWNNTSPTSSVFTTGGVPDVGEFGRNYVAYLFATCAGVSKVGSYTGNGTTQTINCGFTSGARFVMIKATSTTGNWIVADSARGIVAGNDPALYLNSTAAEVTGLDWIDADNSGFVVNETATIAANTNGVSYIFFAVA